MQAYLEGLMAFATTNAGRKRKFGFSIALASPSSFSLAERAQVNLDLARSGVSCTNFSPVSKDRI